MKRRIGAVITSVAISLVLLSLLAFMVMRGIERDGWVKDSQFLVEAVRDNYVYKDLIPTRQGKSFEDVASDFLASVKDVKNKPDFLLLVSSFLGGLMNPHTTVYYGEYSDILPPAMVDGMDSPVQEKDYIDDVKRWGEVADNTVYSLPIKIKYISGRYIVTDNGGQDIKVWSEVVQVNSVPVDDYVRDNMGYWLLTSDRLNDKYYFGTLSNINATKPMDVLLSFSDGKEISLRFVRTEYNFMPKKTTSFKVSHCGKKILYVHLTDFIDITNAMSAIASATDIDALILDVRDNGGGMWTLSEKAAQRINGREDFLFTGNFFMKKTAVDEVVQTPTNLIDSADMATPLGGNKDDYLFYERRTIIARNDIMKGVDTYVLSNNYSYSATEYFLQLVQKGNIATIVGDYSGGGLGITPTKLVYLKNSKLVVRVEVSGYYDDGYLHEQDGTTPDVLVQQDVGDYIRYLATGGERFYGSDYDTVYQRCLSRIADKD